MYKSIYYDKFKNRIHLWDDVEGYFNYEYEPYAFISDPTGEYETITGEKVRKITQWDDTLIKSGHLYEYDIKPEVRTLIDLYGHSDEISNGHCIFYFDIEVSKETKHSTPQDANNPIISICGYDTVTCQMVLYLLDSVGSFDRTNVVRDDVIIHRFSTERELLVAFIEYYKSLDITILSGWNIIGYDLPYLYNRSEKLFGKYKGSWLSPINKVQSYRTRANVDVFIIGGIAVFDYLQLYKTFTTTELPNYNLDAVGMFELKKGKIKYDGTLQELFETDVLKFIDYNIEDVVLVMELESKLDFISIALGVCHKGHVPYDDVYFTSRYMDGACITEVKRRGQVVSTSNRSFDGEKAAGALVKTTRPGKYSWVYDLDLKALYPSNIISLNISPETQRGKILNWDSYEYVRGVEKLYTVNMYNGDNNIIREIPHDKLLDFFNTESVCVSGNGVLYTKLKVGLIPSILLKGGEQRAKYRSLAAELHAAGKHAESEYYERKQKIEKVLLNSLYGVLLLPSFRFYDKDNGEAVTVTGQQVIKYTQTMINHLYNTACDTKNIDYCVYSDTDSVFFEALQIINSRKIPYTEDNLADLCIDVAVEVQNFVNSTYDIYAKEFHNIDKHVWEIKQEFIAKRAFWGDVKKRYAMWLIRDGRKTIDRFDIKGFDSVRSNFPKIFRKFLEELIHDILGDSTKDDILQKMMKLKDDLPTYDIYSIMNPTGVNKLEEYTPKSFDLPFKLSTPIHIKAAINHNKMLKLIGSPNTAPIYSGDKIVWVYLIKNPYSIDAIALKGYDDDPKLVEFVEKYIYRDKLFDKALENKVQSLWDSLGWGKVILNRNISKIFEID